MHCHKTNFRAWSIACTRVCIASKLLSRTTRSKDDRAQRNHTHTLLCYMTGWQPHARHTKHTSTAECNRAVIDDPGTPEYDSFWQQTPATTVDLDKVCGCCPTGLTPQPRPEPKALHLRPHTGSSNRRLASSAPIWLQACQRKMHDNIARNVPKAYAFLKQEMWLQKCMQELRTPA